MGEIIGFHPTNQNTLYFLHLFCSDIEIIYVHGRPAFDTLIGWGKCYRIGGSLSGFSVIDPCWLPK